MLDWTNLYASVLFGDPRNGFDRRINQSGQQQTDLNPRLTQALQALVSRERSFKLLSNKEISLRDGTNYW